MSFLAAFKSTHSRIFDKSVALKYEISVLIENSKTYISAVCLYIYIYSPFLCYIRIIAASFKYAQTLQLYKSKLPISYE